MKPASIWVSVALFYMYQFVIRVSPSVMVDDLMLSYHVGASEIGSLTAIAMYFYSLLQIPSGILVDVYGVRKVVLGSIVLCVLGVLIFVSTESLMIAKLGRVLIGSGSAAAFLSVSKVSALWFPPAKRATLYGMTMAAGTIGALNGSTPLTYLIASSGWRQSMTFVALLGGIIFILNFLFLREQPNEERIRLVEHEAHKSSSGYMKDVLAVLRLRTCWISAFAALGIYLSINVLADLWGISFLMQAYGLNKPDASKTVSLIYVGLCSGSLSLTIFSDWIGRKKELIQLSAFAIVVALSLVVYYPALSPVALAGLFFVIGFFCGAEMLCFATGSEATTVHFSGTVTGFINFIVMMGGAVIQEQVGKLLDLFWTGDVGAGGMRVYTTLGYQKSFAVVVAIIFASFIVASFLPGTPNQRGAHPDALG